ncbi:hypothetical protein [Spirosoma foliorum]|uniref:Uncharacterized protein n=1 Tax=Spirosoma foliorum TaxID=2710596 RepID=A0A7G5H3T6_9BACT|nr:hypothetical protein [Spirosoma foliorum]QMW05778.1 hypothetical protein H3H32_13230 [Spirosoma foliorum]
MQTQPIAPESPFLPSPENFLNDVENCLSLYTLNVLKDRLVSQHQTNPQINTEAYDAIWKAMHRKSWKLKGKWNKYRHRFLANS